MRQSFLTLLRSCTPFKTYRFSEGTGNGEQATVIRIDSLDIEIDW